MELLFLIFETKYISANVSSFVAFFMEVCGNGHITHGFITHELITHGFVKILVEANTRRKTCVDLFSNLIKITVGTTVIYQKVKL